MESNLFERLEQLHEMEEFEQIISIILEIENWKDDYKLASQLARAYNNVEQYEKALEILEELKEDGREDAYWHYRKGYALYYLERMAEAAEAFKRVTELETQDLDAWRFLQWCYEHMGQVDLADRAEEHLKRAAEEHRQKEAAVLSGDEVAATEYLFKSIHKRLGVIDTIEENHIVVPQWDIVIYPWIEQLTQNSVTLDFRIYSDAWDRSIFECSVGFGETLKNAIDMAVDIFLLSMIQGIKTMKEREIHTTLNTTFVNHSHKWNVYRSNIAGIGQTLPQQQNQEYFWNVLKDKLALRLGNQKLCYIKIFGSKNGEYVIGECRVNDVASKELSDMVAELVSSWDTQRFASMKQFFFLEQDASTCLPYPYKEYDFFHRVKIAVELFEDWQTRDDDIDYVEELAQVLDDVSLAEELNNFIPELCAEQLLEETSVPEILQFNYKGKFLTVYKSQLASYYPIREAVYRALNNDIINRELYSEYVSFSALGKILLEIKEKEGEFPDATKMATLFTMSDEYQLR